MCARCKAPHLGKRSTAEPIAEQHQDSHSQGSHSDKSSNLLNKVLNRVNDIKTSPQEVGRDPLMEQHQHDKHVQIFHGQPSSSRSPTVLDNIPEKIKDTKETKENVGREHNAKSATQSNSGDMIKYLMKLSRRSHKSERMKESHMTTSKLFPASKVNVPSHSHRLSTFLKQNTLNNGTYKKRKGRKELSFHPSTLKFLQQLLVYLKKADTKL